MVVFTFYFLDREYPFLESLGQKIKIASLIDFFDKFGAKNQNCQFNLSFGT